MHVAAQWCDQISIVTMCYTINHGLLQDLNVQCRLYWGFLPFRLYKIKCTVALGFTSHIIAAQLLKADVLRLCASVKNTCAQ